MEEKTYLNIRKNSAQIFWNFNIYFQNLFLEYVK